MTDRFVVVPASYVLFLRRVGEEDQILLQLRQGTGYMDGHWATAAAGHVERGESVFAAAAREAAEELGVVVDPADLPSGWLDLELTVEVEAKAKELAVARLIAWTAGGRRRPRRRARGAGGLPAAAGASG